MFPLPPTPSPLPSAFCRRVKTGTADGVNGIKACYSNPKCLSIRQILNQTAAAQDDHNTSLERPNCSTPIRYYIHAPEDH